MCVEYIPALQLCYYNIITPAVLRCVVQTWSMKATKLLFQMTKDKPIVAIKTAYKVAGHYTFL